MRNNHLASSSLAIALISASACLFAHPSSGNRVSPSPPMIYRVSGSEAPISLQGIPTDSNPYTYFSPMHGDLICYWPPLPLLCRDLLDRHPQDLLIEECCFTDNWGGFSGGGGSGGSGGAAGGNFADFGLFGGGGVGGGGVGGGGGSGDNERGSTPSVPVPDPSTWAIMGGLLTFTYLIYQRRLHAGKPTEEK